MFDSIQQLTSEKYLVEAISGSKIQLPSSFNQQKSTTKKTCFTTTTAKKQHSFKQVNSTSKIPLDIGGLDDILFISTISSRRVPTVSNNNDSTTTVIYYSKRYSQPETTKSNHHQHQPYDISYSTTSSGSSSSNSSIIHERRTSVQSDATLSTELIRRFSSGSTTSTIATTISACSIIDNNNTIQQKRHSNVQDNNNIPLKNQQEELVVVRDPGHDCDTMQSPKEDDEASSAALQQPIWVNAKKIKENPIQYQQVLNYLKQHKIPLDSSLPLASPCIFYFSDNNYKCYMSSIKPLFQCDTVWQFSSRWRVYKEMGNKPSNMLINQNIYCFKKDIEPMWEDKVNQLGGRLTINLKPELLDSIFECILCLFIGASLYVDGMVGIVLSKRNRGDRIELWLDESNTTENTIALLKEKLCSLLPSTCYNEINASRYKKHF